MEVLALDRLEQVAGTDGARLGSLAGLFAGGDDDEAQIREVVFLEHAVDPLNVGIVRHLAIDQRQAVGVTLALGAGQLTDAALAVTALAHQRPHGGEHLALDQAVGGVVIDHQHLHVGKLGLPLDTPPAGGTDAEVGGEVEGAAPPHYAVGPQPAAHQLHQTA